MSLRKNVLRYGDLVKITSPEVFIRCGYPWTKQYVKENIITTEQRNELAQVVTKFLQKTPPTPIPGAADPLLMLDSYAGMPDDKLMQKLLDELAYAILKDRFFGGRERTLHTEIREDIRGCTGQVRDRKVVKTGHYVPGSGGYDYYYGGYDYDPPMLRNEETHTIHLIQVDFHDNILRSYKDSELWIPKRCLQKLTNDEYHKELEKQYESRQVSPFQTA